MRAALATNARMGAGPWLAHTRHDYARMLLARAHRSDRERARALLAEAVETYRGLGIISRRSGRRSASGPRASPRLLALDSCPCRSASSDPATWRARSPSAGASRCCARTPARAALEELAALVGGEAVGSNRELAERADLVVLAHKPAQLDAVAREIAGAAKAVVSILARTTQAEVRAAYPETPVFRIEPNTPVEVRRGVLAFAVPDAPVAEDLRGAGARAVRPARHGRRRPRSR